MIHFALSTADMQAGGFVADGRVNGSLNLSRALGDMEYKRCRDLPPSEQMVSSCPDVRSLDLKRGDDFCILACDGIWDVLTEQQVCSISVLIITCFLAAGAEK